MQEYKSALLLLFLLWGFLFGLLISEVARIISDCIDRGWFKGQICKKNKRIRSYRYNRIEKIHRKKWDC